MHVPPANRSAGLDSGPKPSLSAHLSAQRCIAASVVILASPYSLRFSLLPILYANVGCLSSKLARYAPLGPPPIIEIIKNSRKKGFNYYPFIESLVVLVAEESLGPKAKFSGCSQGLQQSRNKIQLPAQSLIYFSAQQAFLVADFEMQNHSA